MSGGGERFDLTSPKLFPSGRGVDVRTKFTLSRAVVTRMKGGSAVIFRKPWPAAGGVEWTGATG